MVLIIILIVVALLIALIVFCKRKILPKCCPSGLKLLNFIQSKLMYNSILRALMQTFLANCIAMWLALSSYDVSSIQGAIDFLLAVIVLVFTVMFPVMAYKFLHKNEEIVSQPTFKAKFDSIFQNVDYHNKKALAYASLFLGRRLLYAFVIVNF